MRSFLICCFGSLLLTALASAVPIPLNFDSSLNAGNGGTNTASGELELGESVTYSITIPADTTLPNGSVAEGLRVVADGFFVETLIYSDPDHPEAGVSSLGMEDDFLAPLFSPGKTFYIRLTPTVATLLKTYEITASAVIVKDAGTLPSTAGEVFYDSAQGLPAPGFQPLDLPAYYKLTIPAGNSGVFLVELSQPQDSVSEVVLTGRQGGPPGILAMNGGNFSYTQTHWAGLLGSIWHQYVGESAIVPIQGRDTFELEAGIYYLKVYKGPGYPPQYRLRLKTAPASQPVTLDGTTVSAAVPAGGWQWFHFVMPDPPPPGFTLTGTEGFDWILRDTLRPAKIPGSGPYALTPISVVTDEKTTGSPIILV